MKKEKWWGTIDDISYEEINSKEKILTTNDSKEISKLYL